MAIAVAWRGIGTGRMVRAWLGAMVAAAFWLPAADAAAAKADFMGFSVEPLSGVYRVVKDVNVRAGPSTEADKVGQVSEGTEVEVVGKAKGGWIGIRRGGRDLGFVFETYLKATTSKPLERDRGGRIVGTAGKPVAPASGRFLVTADTDVRVKPAKDGAKREQLERGTRVEAMGASDDGKWLAVRWSGREMGFVPLDVLLPLIDGDLRGPVSGSVKWGRGTCGFTIRFTGKSQVEDDIVETADYDVDWQCEVGGKRLAFPGYMFITEAPFQLTDNQVYQISVDLLDVAREYDEAFSTVFLYRRAEGKVVFDSVSMKDLGGETTPRELPAKSVRDALVAAATLAPSAWNNDLWSFFSEETP